MRSWFLGAILAAVPVAAASPQERTVPPPARSLPKAAEGLCVRQVVAMGPGDIRPVRLAVHPKNGLLYVLALDGDVWEVDPDKNSKRRVQEGSRYLKPGKHDYVNCLGFHVDGAGRAYVVANERHREEMPVRAHIVVYRLPDLMGDGASERADEWVSFDHPFGIGPFNHGASHIATGPDGLIYLSMGSRTDHGDAGTDDHYDKNGETELTACMLRFDPAKDHPKPEVFCRGMRNAFGFAWDDRGRLFAGENGPDANHPEKLNWLRQGKHYGFPYRFGCDEHPMYVDAVPAPDGMIFERPVANLGPDGKPGKDAVCHTFDPHSAPAGMIFYREGNLPARYHRSFFLTRWGSILGKEPVGFDVLQIQVEEQSGELHARTHVILETLRRPIDICERRGKLYVLEHTTYDDQRPCRLLEVSSASR